MKIKKSHLVVLPFLLLLFKGYSQVTISKQSIAIYNDIDTENIFVQQNADVLFSGEQLLYKIYCLNTKNALGVSKIAYVELIDKDKKRVFHHKIRLNSSTGQGDYTIPFSVPTGNYKLIAYTQWMRNSSATNFFQTDLHIINPFIENQDALSFTETAAKKSTTTQSINATKIDVKFSKNTFNKREKIEMNINALQNNASFGNYTLSVRKVNGIAQKQDEKRQINNFKLQYKNEKNTFLGPNKSFQVYPPEHQGEIITGVVLNTKNQKPAANIKVALSIPSKNFIFKTTKTNNFGVFYFDLNNENVGEKMILQASSSKKESYAIKLSEKVKFDYSKLQFNNIILSEKDKKYIQKKSEQIQIENAYRQAKQDSIISTVAKVTFYKPDYSYVLNDYKRFPSIEETMVEVIDHTWVKTRRKKHTFYVRDYKSTGKEDILPLVLIDGILIQNHEDLYDYDIKKVHTINIITDKFMFDNELYGGVISVLTNKADHAPITKGSFLIQQEIVAPIENKKYFEQSYADTKRYKRIPDYRAQLLWKPNVNINTKTTKVTFFSSDVVGDFEVKVEGFTYTGKPVSITKKITVK